MTVPILRGLGVKLAIISAAVPTVLRGFANMQGLSSRQAVESRIQTYYFTFLFVQVFLAVSISVGVIVFIGEMTYTVEGIPAVLAKNLPKACNYFFSYIKIYGFTTTVYSLLQIGNLVKRRDKSG